jgi:hypothetical protein
MACGALDLCSNSSPGLDGIKFNIYKALPMRGNEILLEFFDELLRIGEIPEKWYLTKVVPILKPGTSPPSHDSYWPISLIECDRILMEKML